MIVVRLLNSKQLPVRRYLFVPEFHSSVLRMHVRTCCRNWPNRLAGTLPRWFRINATHGMNSWAVLKSDHPMLGKSHGFIQICIVPWPDEIHLVMSMANGLTLKSAIRNLKILTR